MHVMIRGASRRGSSRGVLIPYIHACPYTPSLSSCMLRLYCNIDSWNNICDCTTRRSVKALPYAKSAYVTRVKEVLNSHAILHFYRLM